MQIIKIKLCRGTIITLETYYRYIFVYLRKNLRKLNQNNSVSGRMMWNVWETNGICCVSENIMFCVFSRPRIKQ